MLHRSSIAAAVLLGALCATAAQAWDDAQYPDITGQWVRAHQRSQWDPSKERGLKQEAPLTPEYQKIFEANLAALRSGRLGVDPQLRCIPAGVPRMMIAYEPLEFIITPKLSYIRTDHLSEFRRIYTDGRDWPKELEPSWWGTSIGKWVDENGDGKYDVLEIESRGFKGPRFLDADGLPLHENNKTVVKERIYLSKTDRNLLVAEITTTDDAFTRPWTVTRNYKREPNPVWPDYVCPESNNHVMIGKEVYFRSADGMLMPTRKDQPPPDLRYFTQGAPK